MNLLLDCGADVVGDGSDCVAMVAQNGFYECGACIEENSGG